MRRKRERDPFHLLLALAGGGLTLAVALGLALEVNVLVGAAVGAISLRLLIWGWPRTEREWAGLVREDNLPKPKPWLERRLCACCGYPTLSTAGDSPEDTCMLCDWGIEEPSSQLQKARQNFARYHSAYAANERPLWMATPTAGTESAKKALVRAYTALQGSSGADKLECWWDVEDAEARLHEAMRRDTEHASATEENGGE